jgi:hypothetical protein
VTNRWPDNPWVGTEKSKLKASHEQKRRGAIGTKPALEEERAQNLPWINNTTND